MDLTMMGMDSMSVGFNNFQLHGIIPSALRYNEEFRDMFLTRLGEMLRGPLSDENAQKTLDELRAIGRAGERARSRPLGQVVHVVCHADGESPRLRLRPRRADAERGHRLLRASPPRMPPNTSDKSEKYPRRDEAGGTFGKSVLLREEPMAEKKREL